MEPAAPPAERSGSVAVAKRSDDASGFPAGVAIALAAAAFTAGLALRAPARDRARDDGARRALRRETVARRFRAEVRVARLSTALAPRAAASAPARGRGDHRGGGTSAVAVAAADRSFLAG